MHFRIVTVLFSLLFLLPVSNTYAVQPGAIHQADAPTPAPFVDNQVLVKFKPGTAASAVADAHRQSGGRLIKTIPSVGVQLVAVPTNTALERVAVYRRNPNVHYAELNYIRTVSPPQVTLIPEEGSGSLLGPYFSQQWGMHNTGQPFYYFNMLQGTSDADVDAPEGWDQLAAMGIVSMGSPVIKVAVLDTGVDCSHVDLAFEDGSSRCANSENFTASPGADDQFGHGTHVAGIIAANTNNQIGVAGIAEIAYLGSFKVCDDSGSCPDAAILSGIVAAADNGYHVINMSFSGPDASPALAETVAYAWDKGVVLVSSAGNEGSINIGYPAQLEQVIAVASSDASDNRSSFSNFGSQVMVAAPGDYILSTMPMSFCGGDNPDPAGCYEFMSGTSMASPHVAGLAALVWARDDVTTNEQVRFIIENSADKVGAGGQNLLTWTEHGRINLNNALTYPTEVQNVAPVAAFNHSCIDLSCSFDGSASNDSDGSITSYAWDFGDGNDDSGSTANHIYASAGSYDVTLTVTDNDGATGDETQNISVTLAGNIAPSASFSYTCSSLNCSFNGTASQDSDGTITSYVWDFGDGQSGAGGTTNHSYAAAGTYTVILSVTDNDGDSGSASASVRAKDRGKSSGVSDGGTTDPEDPVDPFCVRKPDHPKCQ